MRSEDKMLMTGLCIILLLLVCMAVVACDDDDNRILGHEHQDTSCSTLVCCESPTYTEMHSECCADVTCIDTEPCPECPECPDDEGADDASS